MLSASLGIFKEFITGFKHSFSLQSLQLSFRLDSSISVLGLVVHTVSIFFVVSGRERSLDLAWFHGFCSQQ